MTDPITRPAHDLRERELRDVIQEGVYRGIMKAVAVYALISLVILLIIVAWKALLKE